MSCWQRDDLDKDAGRRHALSPVKKDVGDVDADVAQRQHDGGVGIAEDQGKDIDDDAGVDKAHAQPARVGIGVEPVLCHHVTADDGDYRDKAQQIGIEKHAGEAVFVDREIDPVEIFEIPLKIDAEQQAEKADDIQRGGEYHQTLGDQVEFALEVKARLGVHTVKDEEAYQHVQLHDKREQERFGQIQEHGEQRDDQKRADPQPEAHFEKGVVAALVVENQPQSPYKQERQAHVCRHLNEGYHAEKQIKYVYRPEERRITQFFLESSHSKTSCAAIRSRQPQTRFGTSA